MKLIKFDLNHPNVLNAGLIGIDEAGRGALAGPVIAGCVWLSPEFYKQKKFPPDLNQINDSKLLDESTRTHCFQFIKKLEEKNLLITSWGEGTLKT